MSSHYVTACCTSASVANSLIANVLLEGSKEVEDTGLRADSRTCDRIWPYGWEGRLQTALRAVGVEVYLHSFLISKTDEGEHSASRPSRFTPADKNHLSRRLEECKVLCLRLGFQRLA